MNGTTIFVAIGFFILGALIVGLYSRGLNRDIANLQSELKDEKSRTAHKQLAFQRAVDAVDFAEASAKTLHDKLGCTNEDNWANHTPDQPDGLTPERREEIRIAEEKAEAERVERVRLERIAEENRRHDEEARREARRTRSGGFTSADGTWVAVAVSSGYGDSSCDGGGGSDGGGGGGGD